MKKKIKPLPVVPVSYAQIIFLCKMLRWDCQQIDEYLQGYPDIKQRVEKLYNEVFIVTNEQKKQERDCHLFPIISSALLNRNVLGYKEHGRDYPGLSIGEIENIVHEVVADPDSVECPPDWPAQVSSVIKMAVVIN